MNLYENIKNNLKEEEKVNKLVESSKTKITKKRSFKELKALKESTEVKEKSFTPLVEEEVEEISVVEEPVTEEIIEEPATEEPTVEEISVEEVPSEENEDEEDLDIEEKALLGIEEVLNKILEKIGGMEIADTVKEELTECVNSYKEPTIEEKEEVLEQGNYNVDDLLEKIKEKYQDNSSEIYTLIRNILGVLTEETYDRVLDIVLNEKEEVEEETLTECEINSFKVTRVSPKTNSYMLEADTKEGIKYFVGKGFDAKAKTLEEAEIFTKKGDASLKFKSLVKEDK